MIAINLINQWQHRVDNDRYNAAHLSYRSPVNLLCLSFIINIVLAFRRTLKWMLIVSHVHVLLSLCSTFYNWMRLTLIVPLVDVMLLFYFYSLHIFQRRCRLPCSATLSIRIQMCSPNYEPSNIYENGILFIIWWTRLSVRDGCTSKAYIS